MSVQLTVLGKTKFAKADNQALEDCCATGRISLNWTEK